MLCFQAMPASADASSTTTTSTAAGPGSTGSTTTQPEEIVAPKPPEVSVEDALNSDHPSIELLRASQQEIADQMAEMSKRRAEAETRHGELVAQVDQAKAAEATSVEQEAQARATAEDFDRQAKKAAIDVYVGNVGGEPLAALGSDNIYELSARLTFLSNQAEQRAALFRQRREAHAQLEQQRQQAEQARADLEAREAQASAALDEIAQAQQKVALLDLAVDDRLESALAEAESLKTQDPHAAQALVESEATFANAITAPEAPEGIAIPDVTVPPKQPPAASVTTTTAVSSSSTTSVATGDGSTAPPSSTTTTTTLPPIGTVDVVKVYGFQVARAIADPLKRMLDAARLEGLTFGGGGYRSTAQQIELRKAHCGPTYYDIWEKPSSQCSPPTARPGRSMHERGLALDFTCNGQNYAIPNHASPCWRWLALHAADYGLYNLPSEPWHWSVNGN